MIKVCFINGSPKRRTSCSQYLIDEVDNLLDKEKCEVIELFIEDIIDNVEAFKIIESMDKLVIVSPLYIQNLTSQVIEFLTGFEVYVKENNISHLSIYGIINCGILDGKYNKLALDVLKNFCIKSGLKWRIGVGVGSGAYIKNFKHMSLSFITRKKVYDAFWKLTSDIQDESKIKKDNILISPLYSKSAFMNMEAQQLMKVIESNGLTKEDLYASPHSNKQKNK